MMLPVAGEKKRTFSWKENLSTETKAGIAKVFANVNDSAFVMVPVDVLLSTELSSELANHTETTWKDDFKQFFKDGGILMYPIAALFLLGVLMFLWRFAWLAKAYTDRASAEKALEVLFAGEVPKLEKGLSWISVFASTAPLLGLLGTVMGMSELFDVITMHGTSDPKLLAGGISIALVTTEAGLIVAIPLQLLHTFLVNRADALRTRMEKSALAVLNAIWIKEKSEV